MARYADQLPINLAPNGANFLLSTNDSDGKALERIPLELAGGGSKKYTIIDELALDVDSNLALSAGLYLYVGNAPANFDLSALVDGERVEIINHTAHKVYLFGFNNWVWNGVITALQTDKGLIVEKGGLIAAKHSGNLLLFNTLPNILAQDWRSGFEPPILERTYVSPGDTNGIIYYLGATKYDASFVNPHIRGDITATASSIQDAGRTPDKAFIRSNSGTNGCWHGQSTNTGWLRIQFNGKRARVNSFELWSSSSHALSSFMGDNCLFQASNDGINWITLLTFFPNVAASARYYSGDFINNERYSYYRFYSPRNGFHVIGDVELYGGIEI